MAIVSMTVTIRGTAPYVVNKFDHGSRRSLCHEIPRRCVAYERAAMDKLRERIIRKVLNEVGKEFDAYTNLLEKNSEHRI